MTVPSEALERFQRLFSGLTRSFGQYTVGTANDRGKMEGRARTWSNRPLAEDDYRAHLAGERGLGVVPIRDDSTCLFGAIDVDMYPIDPRDIAEACVRHGLPLVLCRSKSGGVHCYLFLSEPAPAPLVVDRLEDWARLIGHPGVEVFPKHREMEEGSHSNWINLPYFDAESTLRYGYGADARALELDAFLDFAESRRMEPDALERWSATPPPEEDNGSDWFGAPPCLQHLGESDGFRDGQRNRAMFNLALYLKKRHPMDWRERCRVYNEAHFYPPMRVDELRELLTSVGRRDYFYTCSQEPIRSNCRREACRTRRFGVGGGAEPGEASSSVAIGRISKLCTEPPTYYVEVAGSLVEMSSDELLTQRLFWKRVCEEIDVWGHAMNGKAFHDMINAKLGVVDKIPAPEESTLPAQVRHQLVEFCTQRSQARAIDELLQGRPWTEDGRTYFVPANFFDHLHLKRVAVTRQKLAAIMHDLGLAEHRGRIKGRDLVYWSVPTPSLQNEPFDPRIEAEEAF